MHNYFSSIYPELFYDHQRLPSTRPRDTIIIVTKLQKSKRCKNVNAKVPRHVHVKFKGTSQLQRRAAIVIIKKKIFG